MHKLADFLDGIHHLFAIDAITFHKWS
jgi:hypothetical protein